MEKMNKTRLKVLLYLTLLIFAILNIIFLFNNPLKSQGQGDGLPEIITGLFTFYIGPAIIIFSLIGLIGPKFKSKWIVIGGFIGVIVALMSMFVHPLKLPGFILSIGIGMILRDFNLNCFPEGCFWSLFISIWSVYIIYPSIGMFIGFLINKKKKNS